MTIFKFVFISIDSVNIPLSTDTDYQYRSHKPYRRANNRFLKNLQDPHIRLGGPYYPTGWLLLTDTSINQGTTQWVGGAMKWIEMQRCIVRRQIWLFRLFSWSLTPTGVLASSTVLDKERSQSISSHLMNNFENSPSNVKW